MNNYFKQIHLWVEDKLFESPLFRCFDTDAPSMAFFLNGNRLEFEPEEEDGYNSFSAVSSIEGGLYKHMINMLEAYLKSTPYIKSSSLALLEKYEEVDIPDLYKAFSNSKITWELEDSFHYGEPKRFNRILCIFDGDIDIYWGKVAGRYALILWAPNLESLENLNLPTCDWSFDISDEKVKEYKERIKRCKEDSNVSIEGYYFSIEFKNIKFFED